MFAGESIWTRFKAKNYIIDQIIDWFGLEPRITKIDENECMVDVRVNEEAFFCWAMQYGLHIEVLEPLSMRERIKNAVKELNDKYSDRVWYDINKKGRIKNEQTKHI